MTDTEFHEPRHPIAIVSERTRLSPDVLRIWERRYRAVTPSRGSGGQRLYSDADVERLLLLHRATAAGRSISSIVALSDADLGKLVQEDEDARHAAEQVVPSPSRGVGTAAAQVSAAMDHAVRLDDKALDAHLRHSLAVRGVLGFTEEIVAPFCRKVGEEWHAGRISPAQEHLATSVVRRILASAIADLALPSDSPLIVIATPSGERHEIGAMLAAAAATIEGWRVLYLGPDLPAKDIADAAIRRGAHAVGLSLVYVTDREATRQELEALRGLLPDGLRLALGGDAVARSGLAPDGFTLMKNTEDLRAALRAWGAAVRL